MNLFFDTSALVKFFHEEKGTETVTQLILGRTNEVWILELARVEFISAVSRRFRNREMNERQLNAAIDFFENEIAGFNIEPLGHAVVEEAESILKKFGKTNRLRTLDALHLGAFSLISESNWFFVASDNQLCKIAELIGLKTINPVREKT